MTPAPVRIRAIAAGGDGVGRLDDGRAVFVPRTAPGDLVRLTLVHTAKRFARGRVVEVLEPGPGRVDPPCPHYEADRCGGCQLQHLDQPAQLASKRAIIGDALRRIGRREVADPEVIPARQPLGYRFRITLAADARGRIGLHPLDRPDQVFQLERCLIAHPGLMTLWAALQPARGLLPPDLTHLVLRVDRLGLVHLVVESRSENAWTQGPALGSALEAVGLAATVWWHPEGGAPRVVSGAGQFPATVFEQVNPEMGDLVRTVALGELGQVNGKLTWDLYAGVGDGAVQLAEQGARVEAVESDPRAAELARSRLEETGSQVITGRVEENLARLSPPEMVLANPPRGGMHPLVVDRIRMLEPSRLVYVSCDPATLARDLARLGPGYRLVRLQGYDLFPQTAHVETVAVLERA